LACNFLEPDRTICMPYCNARPSLITSLVVTPERSSAICLFLFFGFITTLFLLLRSSGLLPPNTTRSPTTKRTRQSEVDVLLAVQSDHETWYVDDLLSNSNVTLLDEDTGMVDGFGETELVDTGLQAAFKEIFDFEGEHVVEFHAGFVEHTDTDETSNEGVSFEETLGIFFIECEELTEERY
jgi:hypothetical protein